MLRRARAGTGRELGAPRHALCPWPRARQFRGPAGSLPAHPARPHLGPLLRLLADSPPLWPQVLDRFPGRQPRAARPGEPLAPARAPSGAAAASPPPPARAAGSGVAGRRNTPNPEPAAGNAPAERESRAHLRNRTPLRPARHAGSFQGGEEAPLLSPDMNQTAGVSNNVRCPPGKSHKVRRRPGRTRRGPEHGPSGSSCARGSLWFEFVMGGDSSEGPQVPTLGIACRNRWRRMRPKFTASLCAGLLPAILGLQC